MKLYGKFIVTFILTSLLGTSFFSFFGSLYETASVGTAVSVWGRTIAVTAAVCLLSSLLLIPAVRDFFKDEKLLAGKETIRDEFKSKLNRFCLVTHVLLYPVSAGVTEAVLAVNNRLQFPHFPSLILLSLVSGLLMMYTGLYTISKLCRYRQTEGGEIPFDRKKKFLSSRKWLYRFFPTATVLIWLTPFAAVSFFVPIEDTAESVHGYSFYLNQAAAGTASAFVLACIPILMFCFDMRFQTNRLSSWVQERKQTRNFKQKLSFCFMSDMIELEENINEFMSGIQASLTLLEQESEKIISEKENLVSRGTSAAATLNTISELLSQIRESSVSQKEVIDLTDTEVNSLVSGAMDMIQQVSFQNQSIQQSSASVSEISSSIASIAEMARQADIISTMMKENSESGHTTLNRTIETIQSIQTASLDIQTILQSIQKIAKQTNLLSMNASIEAAHAGETGRGFAIVADEVRSLSSLSNRNAKEIETHIETMIEKVNHGVDAITAAGNAFNDIVSGIGENFELMNQIAESMSAQQKTTQSTLESTFNIVKSVEQISSFAERQNQYTQNAKRIMDEIVSLTDDIGKTIEHQQKEMNTLSELTQNAVIHIETDQSTAKDMLASVRIFQNDFTGEERNE